MRLQIAPGPVSGAGYWSLLAIFLAVGAGIFLLDGPPGASFASDVDDLARKMQIIDLVRDGQWHDMSWPFLKMTDAYQSPWSRLVDAPYVLLTWFLGLFMDTSNALEVACLIVPPLWFVAYAGLAVRVITHLTERRVRALPIAAAAFASIIAISEFYPGRIDHHNVQLVLMMALCLGLVSPHRHAGFLVGLSAFLSVAVGLECVPFVAIALVALGIAAVFSRNEDLPRRLSQAGIALAAFTLPGSLILIGSKIAGEVHCDALSLPWIVAMCSGGVVLASAPLAWKRPQFAWPAVRFASLAIPGAALLIALWFLFPICHQGPLHMINPVAQEFWFSRINQEQNLVQRYAAGGSLTLSFIPIALAGVAIATWSWARPRHAVAILVFTVACGALVLTLLESRSVKFPAVFIPLFIPSVVQAYPHVKSLPLKLAPLLVPLCAGAALVGLVQRAGYQPDLVYMMTRDPCRDADLSILDALPPGAIMAPTGLSVTLAQHMQLTGSTHPVGALPFHRASDGIRDAARTFILTDPAARRTALEPFDYVAVCRLKTDLDPSAAPIYAALVTGEDWPGLIDVETGPAPSRFRVMRIDHDALR